jgi:hypothetical protein
MNRLSSEMMVFYPIRKIFDHERTWNSFGTIVLLIATGLFCFACTLKVPMAPTIDNLGISEKIDTDACLLITQEMGNYIFTGYPQSQAGSARPHEFPLGEALEIASVKTFSQVFKNLTLIRTYQQAQGNIICIEPQIEDFNFRYGNLWSGEEAFVYTRIKVRVTLTSGQTKIWERVIASPDQKNYFDQLGESASESLVFTLKKIAMEIAEDEYLRNYLRKK